MDSEFWEDIDMTNLPRLRNSLSNKGAGPLPLPTNEELNLIYPFTEDPLAGTIDTDAVLQYIKGK